MLDTMDVMNQRPKSPEEAAERFYKEVLADEIRARKGVLIGSDRLKDYFGKDYDLNNRIYSKAAYMLFDKVLKESHSPVVLFTAGGPGSGKTEVLAETALYHEIDCIIYDSTFSVYEGSKMQVEAARAAGKKIFVYAVLANLDAARRFTFLRERQTGRGVSDEAFARHHSGFARAIRMLLEEGALNASEVALLDLRKAYSVTNVEKVVAHMQMPKEELIDVLRSCEYDKETLAHEYGQQQKAA